MASIIERNGRYLVRVRMQGFKTVTKTFNRKSDGAAWGRRVETDMEAGRWQEVATRTPSFREAVQAYRSDVAPKLKGAATYRYRFDEFEGLPFADRPIDAVSAADLANWRDQQLKCVKPATVTRKLAMISSIFSWAIREQGWLASNPMALIRKPRASDSRTRTLSDDEVVWLMAAASSSKASWLPAALTVLMHSAMRRSELCGLRRGDVDYEAALAHLADTKNGSPRDVPLCPRSLQALRVLDDAAKFRGDDVLLPIGPAGSLSTRFTVTVRRARSMYLAACREAGAAPADRFLKDIRLHDLRHHAVTAWASSGALSVAELMAISGHKSLRMLMRYTHLQPVQLATKLATMTRQQDTPTSAS